MKVCIDIINKYFKIVFLICISCILFVSCQNNSSYDGQTKEKDYCGICAGIQDETHEHDYCNTCEGDQTDPSHTCPVEESTLSAEVESIGNGTYSIANFMVSSKDNLNEKISENLECAEKHIKVALGSFTPEFQAKYSEELALITDENAFKQNNDFGFDLTIERLNDSCAPIFEEIIENIDTPLDRARFIRYYQALSNEAYKNGSGDYFNGNQTQEDTYNSEKNSVITAWEDIHYDYDAEMPIEDIASDIENGCTQITAQMQTLLTNSNVSGDMSIDPTDLTKLINLSLNISSLDAMHDYSASKKLSTHASCVTSGNTLTTTMRNKHISLGTGLAMIQNDTGIELC